MSLKLCEPLGEWRPDVPDLWPFCVECGRDVKTGNRYAVGYPNRVVCIPCSGLRAPAARPGRATIVSDAERRFGGGA